MVSGTGIMALKARGPSRSASVSEGSTTVIANMSSAGWKKPLETPQDMGCLPKLMKTLPRLNLA